MFNQRSTAGMGVGQYQGLPSQYGAPTAFQQNPQQQMPRPRGGMGMSAGMGARQGLGPSMRPTMGGGLKNAGPTMGGGLMDQSAMSMPPPDYYAGHPSQNRRGLGPSMGPMGQMGGRMHAMY
jgi:hypothetical protein